MMAMIINLPRSKGKVEDLKRKAKIVLFLLEGKLGIGHTRWLPMVYPMSYSSSTLIQFQGIWVNYPQWNIENY